MEDYSSGQRGSPAKGVGRETGARVRISCPPPKRRALTFLVGAFSFSVDFRFELEHLRALSATAAGGGYREHDNGAAVKKTRISATAPENFFGYRKLRNLLSSAKKKSTNLYGWCFFFFRRFQIRTWASNVYCNV